MTTAPQLMTIPEAAARLAISDKYAYRLVQQGRIETVRMGSKCVRITEAALAAYVAQCTNPASKRPLRSVRTTGT